MSLRQAKMGILKAQHFLSFVRLGEKNPMYLESWV